MNEQAIRAAPSWSEPSPLAGQSTGSPDSVIGEPTPAEWARHLRAARDRGRLALPLHPSEVSETENCPRAVFLFRRAAPAPVGRRGRDVGHGGGSGERGECGAARGAADRGGAAAAGGWRGWARQSRAAGRVVAVSRTLDPRRSTRDCRLTTESRGLDCLFFKLFGAHEILFIAALSRPHGFAPPLQVYKQLHDLQRVCGIACANGLCSPSRKRLYGRAYGTTPMTVRNLPTMLSDDEEGSP